MAHKIPLDHYWTPLPPNLYFWHTFRAPPARSFIYYGGGPDHGEFSLSAVPYSLSLADFEEKMFFRSVIEQISRTTEGIDSYLNYGQEGLEVPPDWIGEKTCPNQKPFNRVHVVWASERNKWEHPVFGYAKEVTVRAYDRDLELTKLYLKTEDGVLVDVLAMFWKLHNLSSSYPKVIKAGKSIQIPLNPEVRISRIGFWAGIFPANVDNGIPSGIHVTLTPP